MNRVILLLFFLGILGGCSLPDAEVSNSRTYLLGATEVIGPERVQIGNTAQFRITYKKPNACYYFNGFLTTTHGNTREVAIEAVAFENADCSPHEVVHEVVYEFIPANHGIYEFKFWKENTANGTAGYIVKTIEVISN